MEPQRGRGRIWSLQEDPYDPKPAAQVMERWLAAGGRLAG
jgi:hypothetical protein